MSRTRLDTAASVTLPPWLFGNDILGYARQAQCKLHPVDASANRWRIEALERYERRSAHLVERIEVAAPGAPAHWDALTRLPPASVGNTVTPELVKQKRRQLVEDASGDSLAKLNWIHMSITLASDEQLVGAASSAFKALRAIVNPEAQTVFPNLAAYFIRFDQALNWRASFARVMLRIEEEPALLTNRPQQVAGQPLFGSAWNLLPDLPLTREAYLAPLFLCHAPWIWAIVGSRQQGVMVFALGRPLRGRNGDAAELLQQFMSSGPATSPAYPPVTADQIATTLAWWVTHLNGMLSVATDPATYVDQTGEYRPRPQLEALLSLEQAGRRIQAILAHQRDQPTRRVLAFAALDTLQGLGIVSFDSAVNLARAQKTLDRLTILLPSDVAEVLLPTARRAVGALRECQQGFFPSARVSKHVAESYVRNSPGLTGLPT